MNLVEEIKELVDVKVVIDEKKLADKIFDKAVDPLMLKLVDLIPSEFDNMFYAAKKEELRAFFLEQLQKGVDALEEKADMDLDGKEG